MRLNSHKTLLGAAAILLLVGTVPMAAFASGSHESVSSGNGPVTISWMMRWDNERVDAVAKPVIAAFEKAHPNMTVSLENIGSGQAYYAKLTTLAATGSMPDVTYLAPQYVAIYGSKHILSPLDGLLKSNSIDPNAYYQKVLNFYKYDGKIYGLPLDAAALAIFYNKNMFDAAGVPYPKKGWTWDDLINMGKKFVKDTNRDGIPDQFAIQLSWNYWPVMLKADTDHTIFDNYFHPTKYLMTQDDSIAAMQRYFDMWLKDKIAPTPDELNQISDYFMAGKAAMIMIGSWNMPKYIANIKDFKWDLAPLPLGTTGKEYNRGDGSAFGLSAQSDHQDAAFEFIKFLAGPNSEGSGILVDRQQMLPALKTMAESDRFLHPDPKFTNGATLNKQALFFGNDNQFSMYDPISPLYEKVDAIHGQELLQAADGQADVRTAVQRAASQINPLLADQNQ